MTIRIMLLVIGKEWGQSSSVVMKSTIETETVTSSVAPTVVRRYRHGVLLSAETGGTTTFSSYDAFGRVAETGRSIGNSSPLSVQSFYYSPCGDLLATHTYTNDTDTATEFREISCNVM